MSKEERVATLVDAGILTSKGHVRKPYQRLFTARASKFLAAAKR